MRRLPRMVAETGIGKAVDVVVWRNKSERVELSVELGELPDDEQLASLSPEEPETGDAGTVGELGLTLSSITPEIRQEYGLDEDLEGVVVTEVDASGNAAEKGLQPGDVIIEVDQDPVSTPGEVAQRVSQSKNEGYRVVTLLVIRNGDPSWVAVRLEE
jgi:serine protease Do